MRCQEIRGVYSGNRRTLAFLLACLPMLFMPAAAADDLCGATIVADLTLDHDLVCAGDGLIVGADGIEIDLNQHSITGSGVGVGIAVSGRTNVSIVGGTIANFFTGVRTSTSSFIQIRGNTFRENTDGVDLQAGSSDITVQENAFLANRTRGIMIRGDSVDHVVKENTLTGNRVGILLFGAANVIVKENAVSDSILAGIRVNVFATGNLVVENTIFSNPAGIEFIMTAPGSVSGNTFAENVITTNTCGLKGAYAANTLTENVFADNTSDTCL
jgi:parallel beta-helix repeat protein